MLNPKFEHIKAVFFDLDGTLIHTAPDFAAAVNQLRQEYALEPLNDDKIKPYVSDGSAGLIQNCFTFADDTQQAKARERLLEIYYEVDHQHSRLFENAQFFLQQLESLSMPWGIVTNKPKRYATPLIQKLNLQDRICCLICPDHVQYPKPDPEALFLAASIARVPTEQCFYLGDHLRDIQAGQRANMLTGSVAFGYFPTSENPLSWAADYHFEDFSHIFNSFFAQQQ